MVKFNRLEEWHNTPILSRLGLVLAENELNVKRSDLYFAAGICLGGGFWRFFHVTDDIAENLRRLPHDQEDHKPQRKRHIDAHHCEIADFSVLQVVEVLSVVRLLAVEVDQPCGRAEEADQGEQAQHAEDPSRDVQRIVQGEESDGDDSQRDEIRAVDACHQGDEEVDGQKDPQIGLPIHIISVI